MIGLYSARWGLSRCLLPHRGASRLEIPTSLCAASACVCVCVCESLQKQYACTSEWLCVHWQDLMRRHMFKNSSVVRESLLENMKGSLGKLWCERCTMQPVVGALALLYLELLWPSIYLPAKKHSHSFFLYVSLCCAPFHSFILVRFIPSLNPPFIYSSLTQGLLCPNTASWYAAIEPDRASKSCGTTLSRSLSPLTRTPSAITSSPSLQ